MPVIIIFLSILLWTPLFFTRKSFFNPIVYINLLIYFFFLFKYFLFVIFEIPFLKNTDVQLIEQSIIYFLAFILFAYFIFIALVSLSKNKNKALFQNNSQNLVDKVKINKLFIPIFFLFLFLIIALSFINNFSNVLEFRRFIESGGKFYLLAITTFFVFIVPILFLYFFWLNRIRNSIFNLCLILALIISFIFCVFSGFSSYIITFFLHPLYFYCILLNKNIFYRIAILIPLVCFYVILYSSYREGLFFYDIDFYFSNLPFLLEKIFNRFDYLEMMTLGLQYNFANTNINLDHIYSFFVQFVPRSLWLDKPLNFSTQFTLYIQPHVFFETGSTANFNMLNEFIYIFGMSGFLIGPVIFSTILYICYKTFQKSYLSPYHSLFYILIVMHYLQAGFNGGYVNDLAMPLLLINILLFIIFVKKLKN